MKLPDVPAPGSPLQQSWARDVVNYLRSITPQSSPTVRVASSGPGGVTFAAAKPQDPPQPSASIPLPPSWPIPFREGGEGRIKVSPFRVGVDVMLDGLMLSDADAYVMIPDGESGILYVECSFTLGDPISTTVIDSATLKKSSGPEPTSSDPGVFIVPTHHYESRDVNEDESGEPPLFRVYAAPYYFNSLVPWIVVYSDNENDFRWVW